MEDFHLLYKIVKDSRQNYDKEVESSIKLFLMKNRLFTSLNTLTTEENANCVENINLDHCFCGCNS